MIATFVLISFISFIVGAMCGTIVQKSLFQSTHFEYKENKNKGPRMSDNYYHLHHEETDYLFTEGELKTAEGRAETILKRLD